MVDYQRAARKANEIMLFAKILYSKRSHEPSLINTRVSLIAHYSRSVFDIILTKNEAKHHHFAHFSLSAIDNFLDVD